MRGWQWAVWVLAGSCTPDDPEPQPEPPVPYLAIVIDDPTPGTWVPVGTIPVTGTFENLDDLRLNGAPLVTSSTTFLGTAALERGTNLLEVAGLSSAGVRYATHVSLIAGPLGDPERPVTSAAAVRLNQSGLDLALDVAEGLLDGPAIEALLLSSNPVYEQAGDPTLTVDATSFRLGGADIQVDPGDKTARLTVTLTDLSLGVHVDARYGAAFAELDQTVSADRAVIVGNVAVRVERGQLRFALSDVDVVLTGFRVDTSKWPSWLTGELTDLILTEVVEGVLRVAIVDLIPPILEEQLATLDLSFQTTLLDRPASVAATLRNATFDVDGLALDVDLDVDIEGQRPRTAPGYLASEPETSAPDRESDLAIGLVDDLLNLGLFEAWRAGLLTYTLSTEDGSLPAYLLDALGGARVGIVKVDAELPPTIVERDGGLRAQVGELAVRLDTVEGARGEYVLFALGGHIDLDLNVQGGVLKVAFGDKDLRLAVRDTDWRGSLVEVTAEVEKLLPLEIALGLLADLEFPLPTLAGLKLANATVARDRSGVHTILAVDLERAP